MIVKERRAVHTLMQVNLEAVENSNLHALGQFQSGIVSGVTPAVLQAPEISHP